MPGNVKDISTVAKGAEKLFLGLDASTQSLKATLIKENCSIIYENSIQFDSDLPEFQTQDGVHRHTDGLTVTSPPLMWIAALDLLFERMMQDKIPFERIAAISGSGQQHGSVYLCNGASRKLKSASPALPLRNQLKSIFSVKESPIWMDSSTSTQCKERDAALGGAQAVAILTGSRSYERFTGNQITKIYQETPELYEATERICLVSSFVASLLIGEYAGIDSADGAGMNLMNIMTKQWSPEALTCTAPGLKARLGKIIASYSTVGKIGQYFVKRYGFHFNCLVIAFSGDNPNSLAALRLDEPGDIAISLGTSDTLFGTLSEPKPSAEEGHIFGNPINPSGYMGLLCYKNGSLTREHIRDKFAGHSWKLFEESLAKTSAGNSGHIGFYFREPEITPPVLFPGIQLFNPDDTGVKQFTADQNIRAVIEGQFLSMRLHSEKIGLMPKTIYATGGASVNKSILQILADVFGKNVTTSKQPNSASLGAAYRALHGWQCKKVGSFTPFSKAIAKVEASTSESQPDPQHFAIYTKMLLRYSMLEQQVLKNQ